MTTQHAELPAARIGFVGAGSHATESLYPNLPHIPEFQLAAVCDLVEEKAGCVAARYGAPQAFANVEEMLGEVALDGVCVCGPPRMHYEVGLQVLARGIPVFVEKPPAPARDQAQELAARAHQNHTWGMVGFMKRFAPANLLVKELMAQPEFGKLSSMTAIHGCGSYQDTEEMLLFNGIHMIDLCRFFGGKIEELHAYGSDARNLKAVTVNLRFANGAVGQLNQNCGHTWSDCFEQTYITGREVGALIGASGKVEVMWPSARFALGQELHVFGWSNRYYVSHNMSGWWASGHYTRGYWGELSHFARACLGLAEPGPTLEDGVQAMAIIETIMHSLDSGQPVSLQGIL